MSTNTALKPESPKGYARIEQLPDPPRPPDAMYQFPYLTTAFMILDDHFGKRPDVLVGGEGYLCRDTSDKSGWVAPDCVVAFGVDPVAIRNRNGYVINEVGKPPDFVLEVASRSTGRVDYTTKRGIYARYGVGEYWRFDATGGIVILAALAGERLVRGVYEPFRLRYEPDGLIWGHSPALDLDLCWDNGELRFLDPKSGEFLPGLAEVKSQGRAALNERDAAIFERDAAIFERDAEAEARRAAESEARRLREQLRRLLP